MKLPELPHAAGKRDFVFQFLPERKLKIEEPEWFHRWLSPDERVWLTFAKHDCGYLLRFTELADFLVSRDGKEIRCYTAEPFAQETIRHLLLDHVMPLVISHQGHLVLHGSAIATPQGAVAFLGKSGQGKSTLAAGLSALGFPLITDDCLLLKLEEGELRCVPSYPGVRLWPDMIGATNSRNGSLAPVAHYTEKRRVGHEGLPLPFCSQPVPLRKIYFLNGETPADESVKIVPANPQEAFIQLVSLSYKLDVLNHVKLKEEFESLDHIVSMQICNQLSYTRDVCSIPRVSEAIAMNLKMI